MIGVERLFIYLLAFAIVNHETVPSLRAAMAELVDALASGASVRKYVEVQVLFAAPKSEYTTPATYAGAFYRKVLAGRPEPLLPQHASCIVVTAKCPNINM